MYKLERKSTVRADGRAGRTSLPWSGPLARQAAAANEPPLIFEQERSKCGGVFTGWFSAGHGLPNSNEGNQPHWGRLVKEGRTEARHFCSGAL